MQGCVYAQHQGELFGADEQSSPLPSPFRRPYCQTEAPERLIPRVGDSGNFSLWEGMSGDGASHGFENQRGSCIRVIRAPAEAGHLGVWGPRQWPKEKMAMGPRHASCGGGSLPF